MNQCWDVYFASPPIYSSYLSLYFSLSVLHSLLIYTRIELSVFIGNQHSAMAVDIYVASCGQGAVGWELCRRCASRRILCDTAVSDT
jgi:hypothetical protein